MYARRSPIGIVLSITATALMYSGCHTLIAVAFGYPSSAK